MSGRLSRDGAPAPRYRRQMPTLLRIDSSADLTSSRSRALTDALVEAWTERGGDRTVVVRDLHRDPLPHLASPAQHWPVAERRGERVPEELDRIQDEVIDELTAADAVVIGVPLYNYAVPATLKNWIDLIHVPGRLAPFPGYDVQPMAGRDAVLITAQGATYDVGTPTEHDNHAIPPLRLVLGTALGMNVHVVSTSRTIADRVPDFGAEQSWAEFEAAAAEVRRLGSTL